MKPFSLWIERDLPAVDTPFEGLEGRLLSSPHGQAVFFRAARDNARSGFLAFSDFAPYEPSHGSPASFIATPMAGRSCSAPG